MKRRPGHGPLGPDVLPDVRDGLSRVERTVLVTLAKLQAERGGRSVSTIELWGRLVEELDLSQEELQRILSRLNGRSTR